MKSAIIGIAGTQLSEAESRLLRSHAPAGVILFARNIGNPKQLAGLVAALRRDLPEESVLMIDQEGGRVARLRPPHWPALPAAADLADREAALLHGTQLGRICRQAGFDVATAPVLDLAWPGASSVIGDRALGAEPDRVATCGAAIAQGLMAEGIIPVMKHLPGHGRATLDSHFALPRVTAGLDELAADFAPFIANQNLPWAMTAHIVYTALDDRPATLSPVVIERVIRGMIGFKGILMSDDLAMKALSGSPADLARATLAAGCDIALYCPGDEPGNQAVLEACPPFTRKLR
ncbi:MAG: beta-N-acetylhexosaminidase [Rhodospirillales bacterium 20-60-12]|nr:MAG: beta-N-acetylhexosaminidase [Rhodospirillales bacterium 20-60-12]HQT68244.1 beta-N-acetylhexosaminidase [Acetobacteraceae bacterium]